MVPSSNPDIESPLGAVSQAVGPDFAWLRVGETQSRCMIRSGDLHLAPVVLPLGLRSIVDAFTRVVPVPTEKATELLYGGALSDPAVRAAVQEGLHPLADRVREIVESVGAHGRPISSVVLDMPGGAMPGLPQALQELWPDQRVVPLESLGLHSPEEMPAVRPETAAPGSTTAAAAVPIPSISEPSQSPSTGAAIVAGAAAVPVIAGVAAASHAAPAPAATAEALPLELDTPAHLPSSEPLTVASSQSAAQDHVASGSAFIAWLAGLAFLLLLLCIGYLLNRFQEVNNRLDTLGLRLEQVWSRQEANAPGASSQRASLVPVQPILPVTPLTVPAPGSAGIPRANGAVRPPNGRPFAGANLPGVTGPGLLDLPVTRAGGRTAPFGGPGAGIPGLGGSAGNGGGSAGPYLAEGTYSGPGSLPGSLSLDNSSPFAPYSLLPVQPAAGATMMAERPTVGPQAFPLASPGGFDNPVSFPAPASTFYGATSPVAATLTLPDVLQQAASRSLGPLVAQYREDQSDARSQGDLSQYNLNYGVQGNYSTNTNRNVANSNLGYSYFGLYGSYPLDVFNHRRTAKGVSNAVHAQADIAVASAREAALYDAAQAYLDARQAQEVVAGRREILQVEQQQLRTSRARLAEGFVSRLDVAEAASRVATAENELGSALALEEQAELRLGAAVRSTPGARVQPDPADAWLPVHTASLQSQPAVSLAQSQLTVIQAQANVRQQEASLAVARRGRDPRLSTNFGVDVFGTGIRRPSPLVGINLNYPLNDGGANRAAVRESQAAVKESQTALQQALDRATLDIASAQVDINNAKQHVQLTTAAVEAGREAVRSTQRRYEEGQATFSDVLGAEVELDRALRAQSDAHLTAFRNELNFLRAAGRLRTLQVG